MKTSSNAPLLHSRMIRAGLLVLCVGSSGSACASGFDSSSDWTGCGISYSQHLSAKSDAGGDVKDDSIACSRRAGEGRLQTFELGMRADTPPIGLRSPVFIDGKPEVVSGRVSNQRDTFEAFAGFGEEFDYAPHAAALYNVRAGEINGAATTIVRGFVDATHRWEGKGYSRHAPVSSSATPLLQLSAAHTAEVLGTTVHSYRAGLSGIESVTLGSGQDALTFGMLASLSSGDQPALPMGLPGLALRETGMTSAYAGLFLQETAYDLATTDAGSAREYAYVKLGVSTVLERHLLATLEFTHPMLDRVRQQQLPAYNYIGAVLAYHF